MGMHRTLLTALAAVAAVMFAVPAVADEATGAILPPTATSTERYPDPSALGRSLDELIKLIPPDMLTDLHEADFITVRDLKADLPHGTLTIKKGVIASYKHQERRTAGVVIGECELDMGKLPSRAIVPVKPAGAMAAKALVEGAVLAGWAERCGRECATEWNNAVGKALGLTAPTN